MLPLPFIMDIITKLPRYSDGEIDRAFMREIQRGFEIEKRTEKDRVAQARKEAKQEQGKTHPVLGKCVACLLYTSPSPRDGLLSRMPSSA